MFRYIQDSIDPLVTSVSAGVIGLTVSLLVIVDRMFGLEGILLGRANDAMR